MMEQAQKLQERIADLKSNLSEKRVEFSSGSDAIKVVVNGNHEVIDIEFSDFILKPENIDMLKDLLIAAINGAINKSNDILKDEMRNITGLSKSNFDLPFNI